MYSSRSVLNRLLNQRVAFNNKNMYYLHGKFATLEILKNFSTKKKTIQKICFLNKLQIFHKQMIKFFICFEKKITFVWYANHVARPKNYKKNKTWKAGDHFVNFAHVPIYLSIYLSIAYSQRYAFTQVSWILLLSTGIVLTNRWEKGGGRKDPNRDWGVFEHPLGSM